MEMKSMFLRSILPYIIDNIKSDFQITGKPDYIMDKLK